MQLALLAVTQYMEESVFVFPVDRDEADSQMREGSSYGILRPAVCGFSSPSAISIQVPKAAGTGLLGFPAALVTIALI